MSESANVNFVAGVAESQTEEVDTALPADDREAAVKAVKEALKAEGEKAAKDAKEADENDQYKPKGIKPAKDPVTGKFVKEGVKTEAGDNDAAPKKDTADGESDVDQDELDLKKVLKSRQKLAQAKERQQQEFAKQQQQMRQVWDQMQREKAQIEAEKAKLAKLRNDPASAVREAGWDPEEFILSLAKEGTEEGKMARLLRAQQEKLAEFDRWKEQQAQEYKQREEQARMHQMSQYRNSIENQFLGITNNEEKFPHTQAFFKGREASLIAEGDMIAAQYRELTGKEASLEDIAEYIEETLAERTKAWYENKSKSSQANAPNLTGKSSKGAQGKTLTNSAASDRRSVSKEIADLDGEERLLAAREAVASAIAASRAQDSD